MSWFDDNMQAMPVDALKKIPTLPAPFGNPGSPMLPGPGQSPSGGSGNPMDRDWVIQQILATAQQMQQNGQYVNPSVFNDPGYWADRIIEKGGWVNNGPNQNNIAYFSGRFGMPEGPPMGSGGGGLHAPLLEGYGQTFDYDPNKILESDAFKAALQQGVNALEHSAAARGTVLSGGMLKDLQQFGQGFALNAINDDFGRQLGMHEFNRGTKWGDTDRQFGRLYDFTQLGFQGADQINQAPPDLTATAPFQKKQKPTTLADFGAVPGAPIDWTQRLRPGGGPR